MINVGEKIEGFSKFPIGYHAVRLYRGISSRDALVEYDCKISRIDNQVIFSVSSREGDNSIQLESESADKVWGMLELAILHRSKRSDLFDNAEDEEMVEPLIKCNLGNWMFGLHLQLL